MSNIYSSSGYHSSSGSHINSSHNVPLVYDNNSSHLQNQQMVVFRPQSPASRVSHVHIAPIEPSNSMYHHGKKFYDGDHVENEKEKAAIKAKAEAAAEAAIELEAAIEAAKQEATKKAIADRMENETKKKNNTEAAELRRMKAHEKRVADAQAAFDLANTEARVYQLKKEVGEARRIEEATKRLEEEANRDAAAAAAPVAVDPVAVKKKFICKRFGKGKTNTKVKLAAIFIICLCILGNILLVFLSKDLEVPEEKKNYKIYIILLLILSIILLFGIFYVRYSCRKITTIFGYFLILLLLVITGLNIYLFIELKKE